MLENGPVLVATDFEELADAALTEARAWAAALHKPLSLLHVVPPSLPLGSEYVSVAPLQLRESAQAELERRANASDGTTRILIREGDPATEILEAIDQLGPALVVLGTSAKRLVRQLVFGSVAARVLRKSPAPVLTVNPGSAARAGRLPGEGGKILVPVDFGEISSRAVILAASLADAVGAELCLLHVLRPISPSAEPGAAYTASFAADAEDANRRLGDRAREVGGARTELSSGEPATEILAAIETLSPALVVMGTHGRGAMARAVIGSIAERVVREGTAPVITVGARAGSVRAHVAA